MVKLLSPRKVIPEVPLAGHLKDFLSSWKKLIKDQEILPVVKGYKMPFITALYQDKAPQNIYMSLPSTRDAGRCGKERNASKGSNFIGSGK